MRRFPACFGWLLLVPFVVVPLRSETVPGSAGTVPTFKAKVQVVLVDVVVTNGKDEPVSGLHKEDFEVLEDGKPQIISSFEEHGSAPTVQVKVPALPPHVFSNYQPIEASDSVNVLLLDWLNTQPQDQPYVRAQILKYLQNVRPGARLAIFTLGSQLRMIQGLTSDTSQLLAALDNNKVQAGKPGSPLLPTAAQDGEDRQLLANMAMNQAAPAAIAAVQTEMAELSTMDTAQRIDVTLHAFQLLARYLSSIPGRKNVIWFSGYFPISVFPEAGVPRQFQLDLQRTAVLITPDQVAIYPVSAAGLAADATWDAQYARGPSIRDENAKRATAQIAMEELAKDTGGHAFYNTNGLGDAIEHVVNDGTRYYTLTYTPIDKRTDGTYRNIRIKLRGVQYKLAYRRGYYSENAKVEKKLTPSAATTADANPLLPLMGRGLPDVAQVLYKIRVLPSDPQPAPNAPLQGGNPALKKPLTRYSVDFAISVDDLKLDLAKDGTRQGQIEIMLVAYDGNGKAVNWLTRVGTLSLSPKTFAEAKQVGLQVHQEIDVPSGDVYLSTGVYDMGSRRAGTLGVPLTTVTASAK